MGGTWPHSECVKERQWEMSQAQLEGWGGRQELPLMLPARFAVRCPCSHTQQRCALQSFIPAFLLNHVGYPKLRVLSGIKTLSHHWLLLLGRASPSWLPPWLRCWCVRAQWAPHTHRTPDLNISRWKPLPQGSNAILASPLSCSGAGTLTCGAAHLFSKCSHESAQTQLILFITSEPSNTNSCDRMLPVHCHFANYEKLLGYTACFLKSSEVPALVTFKIVYVSNI